MKVTTEKAAELLKLFRKRQRRGGESPDGEDCSRCQCGTCKSDMQKALEEWDADVCVDKHVVELCSGESILFKDKTHDLGIAKFAICPVYVYGLLKELWITSRSQKKSAAYHYLVPIETKEIGIFSYGGLRDPDIRTMWWCDLHKTTGFVLNVPPGSCRLEVNLALGNVNLEFYHE